MFLQRKRVQNKRHPQTKHIRDHPLSFRPREPLQQRWRDTHRSYMNAVARVDESQFCQGVNNLFTTQVGWPISWLDFFELTRIICAGKFDLVLYSGCLSAAARCIAAGSDAGSFGDALGRL